MSLVDPGGTAVTSLRALVDEIPDGTFVISVAPNSGVQGSARIELDGAAPTRVLVGSSETCQIRLTDPTVSRRHCALEIAGARLRVTDLGATLPGDFDSARAAGPGMRLIHALVAQLGGTLTIERAARGVRFTVALPPVAMSV